MSENNDSKLNNDTEIEFEDFKIGEQTFKVQKGFNKLHGSIISNERNKYKKDSIENVKTLEELKQALEEKENLLSEYQSKIKDTEEITKLKTENEIKKFKKELETIVKEKENLFSLYKKDTIENSIVKALNGKKVYNINQVFSIFKDYGQIDLKNENGNYLPVMKKDDKELTIQDAMNEFLSLEENQNLLLPESRIGGNSFNGVNNKSINVDINTKEGRQAYLEKLKTM